MIKATDKRAVRKSLADFATYDAGLLLNEFLRTSLQFVYSGGGSLDFEPQLHKSLMLRLLSHGVQISDRFTCALIVEMRNAKGPTPYSSHAAELARRLWEEVSVEMATLQRAIRKVEPSFVIRGSFIDPVRFAHCLESALDEVVSLNAHEKYVVFHAWAGCFSMVMRRTYSKYTKVVESLEEASIPTLQDFVETMPLSIDARASMFSRARSEWMPVTRAA